MKSKHKYIAVIALGLLFIALGVLLIIYLFNNLSGLNKNNTATTTKAKNEGTELTVDYTEDAMCDEEKITDLIAELDNVNVYYTVDQIDNGKMYNDEHVDENGNFVLEDATTEGFIFHVTNMSGDYQVEVINDTTKETKYMTYDNLTEDNEFTLEVHYSNYHPYTYTLNIYYVGKECVNQLLKSFALSTPRFNSYSNTIMCSGYSDQIEECEKFVYEEFDESKDITQTKVIKQKKAKLTTTTTILSYKERLERNSRDEMIKILLIVIGVQVVLLVVVLIGIRIAKNKKRANS